MVVCSAFATSIFQKLSTCRISLGIRACTEKHAKVSQLYNRSVILPLDFSREVKLNPNRVSRRCWMARLHLFHSFSRRHHHSSHGSTQLRGHLRASALPGDTSCVGCDGFLRHIQCVSGQTTALRGRSTPCHLRKATENTSAIIVRCILIHRLTLQQIIGFFVIIIPLWVLAPISDAHDVFTTFNNGGGWSSTGVAVMVGMGGVVPSLAGFDCAVHMGA